LGYLVKPFREDELETMITLSMIKSQTQSAQARYVIDEDYSYCYKTQKLLLDGKEVPLTTSENKLLLALIRANGAPVSHEILDYELWNGGLVGESTRRQLIHRLRQKAPNFPIKPVKGMGYKLERTHS
jgi:two-component system OmpR family response regulator/two-component system response regulator QseB